MRVAVVGHVEHVEFLDVARVPTAGEIVDARSRGAMAAGGGAVAAVALARWTGHCLLFTTLGHDDIGSRCAKELTARGVELRAGFRGTQRRAVTFVDGVRERTIVTIGERLAPTGFDSTGWDDLHDVDAVYVTAGDAHAVQLARRARVLVGTSRFLAGLKAAGVAVDALVGSTNDASERYVAGELVPEPPLVVRSDGARGGSYVDAGVERRYAAVPATVTGDTYGAGDCFAAALTLALGEGLRGEAAIAAAAARAVEVLAWHGPYPPA